MRTSRAPCEYFLACCALLFVERRSLRIADIVGAPLRQPATISRFVSARLPCRHHDEGGIRRDARHSWDWRARQSSLGSVPTTQVRSNEILAELLASIGAGYGTVMRRPLPVQILDL